MNACSKFTQHRRRWIGLSGTKMGWNNSRGGCGAGQEMDNGAQPQGIGWLASLGASAEKKQEACSMSKTCK